MISAPIALVALALAGPPAAAPARTARAIVADYVAALGGDRAWSKVKTVRTKTEVEVKGANMRGMEERWATSTGKLLSVMTLPNFGTFREGTDGKTFWSEDPINGLRVKQGVEKEQARIDAAWNADLRLATLYPKMTPVPPPDPPPAGARYECLELVPRQGHAIVVCFDAATHLRVYQKGVRSTPQGETPYTMRVLEWREERGRKIPGAEELTVGPSVMVGRIVEVELDAKVTGVAFSLPRPKK